MRVARIVADKAFIPLTKGYTAVIDAADLPLVEGYQWSAHVKSRTVYAKRTDRRGERLNVYMHRVIAGDPIGLEVDHIDGDGLNNTRTNLRAATRAENVRNQKLSRANKSGFKGVSFFKGRWRAMIVVDRKNRFLGYFSSAEAASEAYAAASAELHKEFGRVK